MKKSKGERLKKRRICRIEYFAVKLEENENRYKYLNFEREVKTKQRNMKVTVIRIVFDSFGTFPKGFMPILIGVLGTHIKVLVQGLEDLEITGRVEIFQQQYCWDRPEYWKESLAREETCRNSNSRRKQSAKVDVKNSQGKYGTFFEVDQRRTQANGPKNKKTNDHASGIISQRRRWQNLCIKKDGRKRTCLHWRQCWRIDTVTPGLHRKAWGRTD